MYTAEVGAAPSRERGGLRSNLLLDSGDVAGSGLAVTWVEVEPGGAQDPHSHPPEQVYVIVSGRGLMRVGSERREVDAGTLVRIPPSAPHGIENIGSETLVYVSAATPAFGLAAAYDSGAPWQRRHA